MLGTAGRLHQVTRVATQTAVGQNQDLGSLIDLYVLRCQVEGKSANTITA
jgi:hypothetical protein